MEYFQPNQPVIRKSHGKLDRREETLPDIIDGEIVEVEEAETPTPQGREKVGNETPTETPPPPPPPNIPAQPAPEKCNPPQQSKLGYALSRAGWGLAAAVILTFFFGGGGDEAKVVETQVSTTQSETETGIRRISGPSSTSRILPAGIYVILAEEGWSEPVSVPLGGDLRWSSMRNGVKFQVQTAGGEVFDYPRPENSHLRLPNSGFVRFRSAEEVPVEIRVTVLHR